MRRQVLKDAGKGSSTFLTGTTGEKFVPVVDTAEKHRAGIAFSTFSMGQACATESNGLTRHMEDVSQNLLVTINYLLWKIRIKCFFGENMTKTLPRRRMVKVLDGRDSSEQGIEEKGVNLRADSSDLRLISDGQRQVRVNGFEERRLLLWLINSRSSVAGLEKG